VQQKTDNAEDLARAAFFVLRSFSEVDHNFREVFADLHDKLRPFLFLADPETSLKYRLKEGVSLKKALKAVEKTNAEWLQVRDQRIAEL
jgi:cell shape-determining protein MreC